MSDMNQERDRDKSKGLTRREFLKKAGIAAVGTAAGLALPDTLKKLAKADSSAPPKFRVLLPQVTNKYQEAPLRFLREFGAPERGVIMKNKVEQGGGNHTYVEMGDQELFNNMLYLRDTYGRPGLKLDITFYATSELLQRLSPVPYDYPNTTQLIPYDSWAGASGTFRTYGQRRFRFRPEDKTLEFHINLPEPKPGKIPTEYGVNQIHRGFMDEFTRFVILTKEDGKTTLSSGIDREIGRDFDDHPQLRFENGWYTGSALWIKMETIPGTGAK